ncbi:alpha/beta fold hydrolase [Bordetella bronchialis]|uniref:Alpha/beta hydrolase n=1 Tax=Bordetella bronchialis TaxID=463025 RepID=A0A193FY63_9BORD|nr:alpha/beta hydrolase [Bordetella bronchialis]ANN67605.1 alpha/beta hydrolase [Bordetella bronchialis]ANN72697.1 alpha/beta hydrolase [Bordetella bronchialis]
MQNPRLDFVTCASPAGMHRMAYWEWGDPDNDKVLLCVHGLTRTGRDFDTLARRLASEYRVVCPDVVGRGASDWLLHPSFYAVPQYVADMVTLLARVRPRTLHWVGTSMGGLIGMALAGSAALSARLRAANQARSPDLGLGQTQGLDRAQARNGDGALSRQQGGGLPEDSGWRVEKMVLNDVGPRLAPDALARIGQYVGQGQEFDSFEDAVAYIRQVSAAFGPHTDEQWRDLARHVFQRRGDRWVKHYDLGLAQPFAAQDDAAMAAGEQLLWQAYEAIDCPILILRGQHSDLLTADTAGEMARRNPRARVLEVPGVGHAPTLMDDGQIQPVAAFLRSGG